MPYWDPYFNKITLNLTVMFILSATIDSTQLGQWNNLFFRSWTTTQMTTKFIDWFISWDTYFFKLLFCTYDQLRWNGLIYTNLVNSSQRCRQFSRWRRQALSTFSRGEETRTQAPIAGIRQGPSPWKLLWKQQPEKSPVRFSPASVLRKARLWREMFATGISIKRKRFHVCFCF